MIFKSGYMKNCKRLLFIKNDESSKNSHKPHEDDLDFMSWKAELNSELLSFWKSLDENYRN
jgi:hypothetical protein